MSCCIFCTCAIICCTFGIRGCLGIVRLLCRRSSRPLRRSARPAPGTPFAGELLGIELLHEAPHPLLLAVAPGLGRRRASSVLAQHVRQTPAPAGELPQRLARRSRGWPGSSAFLFRNCAVEANATVSSSPVTATGRASAISAPSRRARRAPARPPPATASIASRSRPPSRRLGGRLGRSATGCRALVAALAGCIGRVPRRRSPRLDGVAGRSRAALIGLPRCRRSSGRSGGARRARARGVPRRPPAARSGRAAPAWRYRRSGRAALTSASSSRVRGSAPARTRLHRLTEQLQQAHHGARVRRARPARTARRRPRG